MRIRVSPPFGTGTGRYTLINSALSVGSGGTNPVALASLPLTVSNFSSLPELRSITRSFVATEPGLIGLKKNGEPSRVAVTSYVIANWCVSGGTNSYSVNSSAAISGRQNSRTIPNIFANLAGNITRGVYHIVQSSPPAESHIAIFPFNRKLLQARNRKLLLIMNKNVFPTDSAGIDCSCGPGLPHCVGAC